jgi:general secretion pathway protein B
MAAIPRLSFLFRNGETARMSLIHEALQKAEAERRAGELPPLVSMSVAPRRRESGTHRPLWFALGIAVLAAAAYTNRDLIRSDSVAPSEARVATTRDAPQNAVDAPTKATSNQAARKPQVVQQAPAAQPAMDAFTAAQTDAIASHLGAGHGVVTPEAPIEAVPTDPPASIPKPVLPAPVPAESNETAVDTQSIATKPQPTAQVAATEMPSMNLEAPKPPVKTVSEPLPPSAATPVAEDAGTGNASVPLIFELPLATRQVLPPMKVTMQVYHQDPTLRFAIIDGKRVNENGVVGNELNLIEIQRDAMVLEFRGKRFLLPRLGR